jgi:hypothetical protein
MLLYDPPRPRDRVVRQCPLHGKPLVGLDCPTGHILGGPEAPWFVVDTIAGTVFAVCTEDRIYRTHHFPAASEGNRALKASEWHQRKRENRMRHYLRLQALARGDRAHTSEADISNARQRIERRVDDGHARTRQDARRDAAITGTPVPEWAMKRRSGPLPGWKKRPAA